jgi:probable HAF family extracellular repeat protein
MCRLIWGLAALAVFVIPVRSTADYLVTDLGGPEYSPVAINNSGQVAGTISGDAISPVFHTHHAALYSGGKWTDLGTLGGGSGSVSYGYGLNDAGQVVGISISPPAFPGGPEPTQGFLYSGGKMTSLNGLWLPSGINASGQIVGATSAGTPGLWTAGKVTGLGSLPGGFGYSAFAINASGQVAGTYSINGVGQPNGMRAFLSSGGQMTDLGALGSGVTWVNAINASGQVVGASQTAAGPIHAFLSSGGVLKDLGTLSGPLGGSFAWGINASGQVVGFSTTGSVADPQHAFLYTGGKMTDLNSLLPAGAGITLSTAGGINDSGQIIASATNGHSYLLTPDSVAAAPEPGGLALLAAGAVAGVVGAMPRLRRSACRPQRRKRLRPSSASTTTLTTTSRTTTGR